MKEHGIRSLIVTIVVGFIATVIAMSSGCSSRTTPPLVQELPPIYELAQGTPPAPPPEPDYVLEYLGNGRCNYSRSESALEHFAKKEDSLEQLDVVTLFCLGRTQQGRNDNLAKKFFSNADELIEKHLLELKKEETRRKLHGIPSEDILFEKIFLYDIFLSTLNELGYISHREEKFEEAFSYLHPAAVKGNPSAQNNLGALYHDENEDNPYQSEQERGRWLFRSAEQGHAAAQLNLADLLWLWYGNKIEALKWALLAQHHNEQERKKRDYKSTQLEDQKKRIENRITAFKDEMTDDQESQANSLKDEWLGQGKKEWEGAGTGFYVNKHGHILTNEHVVTDENIPDKKCDFVSVMSPADNFPHFVIPTDKIDAGLDLAVLHDQDHAQRQVPDSELKWAKLRSQEQEIEPGEYVIVTGFPLSHRLALEMHTTTGVVVAPSRAGSDRRQFVLSAPVQSGNSGGPVLDANGSVIGVVVSKELWNPRRNVSLGFEPVQNMNYAIRLERIHRFLKKEDVKDVEVSSSPPISNNGLAGAPIIDNSGRQVAPMVSRQAHGYTVLVECWMSAKD